MEFIQYSKYQMRHVHFWWSTKTSIWCYSRRKVENCLICRSYKLDCFLISVLCSRLKCWIEAYVACGLSITMTDNEILFGIKSPLVALSRSPSRYLYLCAGLADSIRFVSIFVFEKNKRINKHWKPNATSLSFKAYRFFSVHGTSKAISVWEMVWETGVCMIEVDRHTSVQYIYIVTTFYLSLLLTRFSFAPFSALCMHSSSFAFDCAVKKATIRSPLTDDGNHCVVRYLSSQLHACMYVCCACYQLEVLNSCMAIIWL